MSGAADISGVEVEDKRWSIAIHNRRVCPDYRPRLLKMLESLRAVKQVQLFEGPQAMEVLLLPQGGKAEGVRRILQVLKVNPRRTDIVYAGDDENDAAAMKCVMEKGGTAIIVGDRIEVEQAMCIGKPAQLAEAVASLMSRPYNQELQR